MAYGKRSTNFDPWRYCARCDVKHHISAMSWQRGKLLCHVKCFDDRLIGQREVQISNVLNDGRVELEIDPKLREPDTEAGNEDILMD